MLPFELENQLKAGRIDFLYLFFLEESYWVDSLTHQLRQQLKLKFSPVEEINFEIKEGKLEDVLLALKGLSFFSTHRLIRVTQAGKIKKGEWAKLLEIGKENFSSNTLLFVFEKKEAYREAAKVLGNQAVSVEGAPPKPRELPTLVRRFSEEDGKRIGESAARLLIELTGGDLLGLKNQTQLLALSVGEEPEIREEHVRRLFSDTAEKDVFALTELLSKGNQAQTFNLLHSLLRQGETPVRLLALLIRHYRILFKIKILFRRGVALRDLPKPLGLPSFIIEKYLSQAQTLSWKKWVRIYREISKTDLALKSSPLPPSLVLENFLSGCFTQSI